MKKTLFSLLFVASAFTAAAQFPSRLNSGAMPAQNGGRNDISLQQNKFAQFFTYLNMSYVDTLDNAKLTEDAIRKVLSELDPHSAYLSPEEMKQASESMGGSFSGIGVEFNILSDTLIVANTIVGGPAEKVGMLPNDRIVEIDGESVVGITQGDVPKKLRGPKGTVVNLKVVRQGEAGQIGFRITRDNIPINTVDAAYRIDPRTGYIKVNRFAATTMSEFDAALDKFGKIDALILDLRGNGGGLLGQAIEMSETFLPRGATVVSTEGRLVPAERYASRKTGRFAEGRLIVLIDENTASGSEIVAGAVQDWDRGLIVGRRSFGKGLVQRQFPLLDGSSVRITTARYHTPTGRVIQRPFEMGRQNEYYASHLDRFDHRGLDTLPGTDSLKYKTLRKGRTVYGGGGVYPDVYVPVDTTGYSQYWNRLVRQGVINEFIIEYMAANRGRIEASFPDFDRFQRGFLVDDAMLGQLTGKGEKQNVPFDKDGFDVSKERLQLVLKALVAQKLWGINEYYQVINTQDEGLRQAERILRDWNKEARQIL